MSPGALGSASEEDRAQPLLPSPHREAAGSGRPAQTRGTCPPRGAPPSTRRKAAPLLGRRGPRGARGAGGGGRLPDRTKGPGNPRDAQVPAEGSLGGRRGAGKLPQTDAHGLTLPEAGAWGRRREQRAENCQEQNRGALQGSSRQQRNRSPSPRGTGDTVGGEKIKSAGRSAGRMHCIKRPAAESLAAPQSPKPRLEAPS